MLNYETILSNYDDKLTLMQWLKKVEAALENASATAFHVNKRGNATLTFSIDFADGTSIESDEFVLQQGESVASARIVNGQLILTLTNGDELNAGNLFNGNLTINGNISVSNNIETEFLNVRDTATLESVEITGSASVGGGLDVGGEITGNSIIENMSGYTFASPEVAGITKNILYASITKQGNLLNLAIVAKLNRSESVSGNTLRIGEFTIPADIGEKLVPTSIAGSNPIYLENKIFPLFSSYNTAANSLPVSVTKTGNTNIVIAANPINNNTTIGTEYFLRVQFTFLLSESMI